MKPYNGQLKSYTIPEGLEVESFLLALVGVCAGLGGSKISRYFDTIRTDVKYTMARARNWACFVSSCKKIIFSFGHLMDIFSISESVLKC